MQEELQQSSCIMTVHGLGFPVAQMAQHQGKNSRVSCCCNATNAEAMQSNGFVQTNKAKRLLASLQVSAIGKS
jgi:hypothetical protein